MSAYLLGIDLGTTAIKAGLFDTKGNKISAKTEEYNLSYPKPLYVEYPAESYWKAFKNCLRRLLDSVDIDRNKIAALSVSAQGETMCFLDDKDRPLRDFIVWLDNRAQSESLELKEQFGQETLHIQTGQADMIPLSPSAKILWVKKNEPEIFEKTKKICLIEDYFFLKLGGIFCGEGSLWCTSFLWNINTKDWWDPMLQALEVTRDQLPALHESGTLIGEILPEIADELGLPQKLPLVMGGLDQACGALGVGNVDPEIFSESTGSALVSLTMSDRIIIDTKYHLPCFYSAVPGMYMIHLFGSGGIALKWLRNNLCEKEMDLESVTGKNAYAAMDELAASIPPGSEGLTVLPHFNGAGQPDLDQFAKCTITGITLNTTRAHMIRAFMEAISANVYRMAETTEQLLGTEIREVIALSGGANSPLWCQMKADMLGKPVVTMKNTQDAACLGAAILAGYGVGIFPSIIDTARSFAQKEHTYYPDPNNRAAYDSLIARYKLLTKTLAPANPDL